MLSYFFPEDNLENLKIGPKVSPRNAAQNLGITGSGDRDWLAGPSIKEYFGVILRVNRPGARVMVTKASIDSPCSLFLCWCIPRSFSSKAPGPSFQKRKDRTYGSSKYIR